jgi:hypothetical protein
MQVLSLIALWVVLVAAALIVGVVFPRRRARRLHDKAGALGFTYHAVARPFLGTRVDSLTILEDGASTEVENALERTGAKLTTIVFDEYLASDTAAVATTFAAFRAPGGNVPVFQIGERNILERMEEALGKKTLKLECDQHFTAHFYVQCEDEVTTREFLYARKLSVLCEHAKHFHVESSPDWLLIYRPGLTVGFDAVPAFVDEATLVAEALLASSPIPLPASA